jgi:hypothetical protein
MKDRIRLAIAFIVVSYIVFGIKLEEIPAVADVTTSATQIELKKEREGSILAGTDEVEIDLINNTLTSKNGLNLKQGDLELKAFNIKRDLEKNRAYVNGELQTLFSNQVGDLSLQSLKGGDVSLDGTDGVFYDNFGYLEVGKVTGAEKPNDKIYFGGDKIEYRDNTIFINDGWLTTDFNINKTKNPNDAGYHLLSENMIIEPDKQITLKNSDFYLGDESKLPFAFPWYRVNIRQGSKVPLFPQWGSDDYYGWNTSWGFLYGNRGDKFVGGFAPKFADTMGVLVGRWENWYKSDNFGTMKLDIDDWLIYSKEDSIDKNKATEGELLTHEEREKRYKIGYTHDYSGEYGKLYFNTINATYNMIPKLDDIVVDYTNHENKFTDDPEKGVRPDLTNTMSFFSMDSDLKNLGANRDITLKSKLKLTDDKKAYALMVYDDIDDIAYGSNIDNDLFSQVELIKDNADYRIGGYYNYLYDMDPGSTFTDTQSRAEDFGFEFLDKDTKIGFTYDEKNGDRFRSLGLWERDPKLDNLVTYQSMYGKNFNAKYSPTMVKEYDRYDTKDLRVSFGEYDFYGDYKVKAGYDYYSEIRELNLDNDYLRISQKERDALKSGNSLTTVENKDQLIKGNYRSKQYNRFQDIIYSDFEQKRGYVDFFNDTTKFSFAGGQTKEEFWDRTGIYTIDGYRKYINESDFYEVSAERNEISLNNFGELALYAGVRYDEYTKGYNPAYYNPKTNKIEGGNFTSGEDSTLRTQLKLNHTMTLFNNEDNENRRVDLSMANDLKLFYQRYDYDSGSINFGNETNGRSAEYIRLKNKDNIYQVIDTINTTVGNTETVYTIDYKRAENPATDELNNEVIKNELEFKIDGDNSLMLNYGQDRKYTDETESRENYNYYTFRDYGITYYLDGHKLSYQHNGIDSKIWDIDPNYNYGLDINNVKNTKEKIRLNTYSYEYSFGDNKLGLDFSEGRDDRRNYSLNIKELDVKNQIYGISFLDGGEVENYYRATYEIYNHNEEGAKNTPLDDGKLYNTQNSDVISFRYEYRDKRFTDDELRRYAEIEYDKDSTSLTPQEIYRVRDILRNRERNHVDFKLDRSIYDDFTNMVEYKRNFRVHFMLQRNDARYERTGDYWDSLEEIQAGVFYSQNRFGIGYQVDESADWRSSKWTKTDREHKLSLVTKIGKPSEGWTLKTYAKFYEDLTGEVNQSSAERARKSSLDGLGIEIGKEMGYYQWSLAFEKEYVLSARDYEWRAALQFTLLTFPTNPIFGFGADTDADKKTSPETYLFDGLKVEDVID